MRTFFQNREKTIKNAPEPREGRWGSRCRWRESNPHGECPTDFESASSTNSNTPARKKKDFIYYIGSAGKKQARSAKKCAVVRFFRKPEMCLSLADRKNRNLLHFIHFAEMIFCRIVHSVQKTQSFSVQCHKIGGQRTIFG